MLFIIGLWLRGLQKLPANCSGNSCLLYFGWFGLVVKLFVICTYESNFSPMRVTPDKMNSISILLKKTIVSQKQSGQKSNTGSWNLN